MGIADYLKGWTPEINKDGSAFDILEGTYKTKVNRLAPAQNQDGTKRYQLELEVTEVLSGNGSAGRKLWKNYYLDQEDSIKALLNDMFTSGITLDTNSEELMEVSFDRAIEKPVFVRAYSGKAFKKVGEKFEEVVGGEAKQKFVIKTEKDASKKSGGKAAKKSSEVPF